MIIKSASDTQNQAESLLKGYLVDQEYDDVHSRAAQQIERVGGTYIIIGLPPESFSGLKYIPQNISDKYVGTIFAEISTLEDISALSGIETLQSIFVKGSAISEITSHNLPNLLQFDASYTQLRSLNGISSCANKLWYLNIVGTYVNDLTPLTDCKKLKTLYVSYCPVDSLEPLRGLKFLRILKIQTTQISSIEALADLERLTELNAIDTKIRDFTPLSGKYSLKKLFLSHEMVDDNLILPTDCPNLNIAYF